MIFQKRFLLLSFALIGLMLAGCETMDGAGRDIEKAGESVQKAAE